LAKGTSAGLLDSSDHAQSVFKHAIIRQYLPPFLAMTGSTSQDRRVVVLDGFAGRGRYPDGTPASAELIMRAVQSLQGSRKVTMFFVENDLHHYQPLNTVVSEYAAQGLEATALPGSVDDHLDEVIKAAQGVPLFVFLDPCGALLPFQRLARMVGKARRSTRPPTEVLLNFSADFTRRTAGQLAAGRTEEAGISRLDVTCGGPWWRGVAMDAQRSSPARSFEPAAKAVVERYAQRLAQAGAMLPVTVPVRRRLHHQPVYHLVFLTRSPYGLWVFAEALGAARQTWLQSIGSLDDDNAPGQATLWSTSDSMQWLIDSEKARAQEIVQGNLRRLAASVGPFRLLNQTLAVFGQAYGVATESTVSTAVRALADSGELAIRHPGNRFRETVVGPARAA
jgi:three-Cys-motif partner protein